MKDPDMVWDFWSLRPESLHQVAADIQPLALSETKINAFLNDLVIGNLQTIVAPADEHFYLFYSSVSTLTRSFSTFCL